MKKNKRKKSNAWQDEHLTKKAKQDNYPARSVYKLQEIQKKFNILKAGDKVLELGASPGSWFLYTSKIVGDKGKIIGLDLKELNIKKMPTNACFYLLNIFDIHTLQFDDKSFDIILSDLAPKTSGIKDVDSFKSFELCTKVLDIANDQLKTGGSFICKIFQGSEFETFLNMVKSNFSDCKIFKPQSCRTKSKEIYIIGQNKLF